MSDIQELTKVFEGKHDPNNCFCRMPHVLKIETRTIENGRTTRMARTYTCLMGHQEKVEIKFIRICLGAIMGQEKCMICGLSHKE